MDLRLPARKPAFYFMICLSGEIVLSPLIKDLTSATCQPIMIALQVNVYEGFRLLN